MKGMSSFLPGVADCDLTSCLFGDGKEVVLRKVKSDIHFRKQAEVFCAEVSIIEIISVGEVALTCYLCH